MTVAVIGGGAGAAVPPATPADERLTGDPEPGEIDALITALGHPQYRRRRYATRRLCAIGAATEQALRSAAAGDDAEVSLRARAVLGVLERRMLDGVEVTIAFSKSRIVWNEPVDLTITLVNRSRYAARVPFTLSAESLSETDSSDRSGKSRPAAGPAAAGVAHDDRETMEAHSRQIGVLLDAAEWLHVRGRRGRTVEPFVDDVTVDARLMATLEERAVEGPVGVLPAGMRAVVRVSAMNRGWARYRLLDRGTYTAAFDYTPAWNDEALAAQRVGRVVSNTASITVTREAPAGVSREGVEASLAIEKANGRLAAVLTNRRDVSVVVNTNFGAVPPFARGQWVWQRGSDRRLVLVEPSGDGSWSGFSASRLVDVAPGETLVLDRQPLKTLQARAAGVTRNDGWKIQFIYENRGDRRWQASQGRLTPDDAVPEVLRRPLPLRLVTSRYHSPAVGAEPGE